MTKNPSKRRKVISDGNKGNKQIKNTINDNYLGKYKHYFPVN